MSDSQLTRRKLLAMLGVTGAGALSYSLFERFRGRNTRALPSDGGSSTPTGTVTDRPQRQHTARGEGTPGDPNSPDGFDGLPPDVVDVREFGAAADGVTDDTAAIRDALDAIAPAGVVLLPPGEILIDSTESAPSALTLEEAHRNVAIVGSGAGDRRTRLLMAPGQEEVHYAIHVTAESMRADDEVMLSNLAIDLNASEQSGVGTAIRTEGAKGTFVMQDCHVTSTRNSGVQLAGGMDADIRYCSFEHNGVDAYGHAISPNQTNRETATTIRNVYCADQRGVSIDVGTDPDTDKQDVTIERCVLKNSMGGLKVDPTSATVSVSNTAILGDERTRIPVKMNPFDFYVGEVRLDNVLIEGGGWPGIDFPNASTLHLRDVAIKNVDNWNEERGIDRGGIRTENVDFGSSGRISIHDVGANNDGLALKLLDGSGSIDTVVHDGTGGLGKTEGVTINEENDGGDPLEPDVPSESEVGPREDPPTAGGKWSVRRTGRTLTRPTR